MRESNPKGSLSVNIRPAVAADYAAIIEVTNEAFAIETFLEGTRTDFTRVSAMLAKGEFLVAEAPDKRIIASVYFKKTGIRSYFGMLAVSPVWQGRGLGQTMVKAAETCCRQAGCTRMDINVLSLRPELLPFYRHLGYSQTGIEEFHPSRPLKAGANCCIIIMSKDIAKI